MRRLAPVIALVALAGCGSSSSDSKAEFIAKADALCEASKAEQEPLRTHLEAVARHARHEEEKAGSASNETRKELAKTLDRIASMAEAGLSKVQALAAPDADADQLEEIFQRTESAFESSFAYGTALENHEDAKAQAIAEKGNVQTRETAVLAKQYGFTVCGTQP